MKTLLLICCLALPCFGQNVLVKFYRDEPNTNLWEKVNGIPPLCISEFQTVSHANAVAGWSTNWTTARFSEHRSTNEVVYNAWYAGVKSNETAVLTINIALLKALLDANQTFLDSVNSGAAISAGVLSNQTVRSARILHQLEPVLRDVYRGQ